MLLLTLVAVKYTSVHNSQQVFFFFVNTVPSGQDGFALYWKQTYIRAFTDVSVIRQVKYFLYTL